MLTKTIGRTFGHKPKESIARFIEKYAQFHPSILTMQKLVTFGTTKACETTSYKFLRKELPVRLANIMKEIHLLPDQLIQQPSALIVEGWYEKSFEEILQFENRHPTKEVLHEFCDTLTKIRNRHMYVVETMAQGVMEMKESVDDDAHAMENRVQYFLDRFYMSRISIRMLINQHTLLFGQNRSDNPPSRHVGSIDPACDVLAVAKDAFDNARFLCERYYLASPNIEFRSINPVEKQEAIKITYVPSHLYHILFELFKNSLRAVVEFHEEGADLPPIHCMVCRGHEDITIKVSDQGGGVARSTVDALFNYMYTTAPKPPSQQYTDSAAPLAGYGYGLPLSRLYAKYFNGDLKISSVDGYGTDATVFMKVLTNEASELLPVFNTTSQSVYKSSTPVGDWSDPTQTKGLHGAVHQLSQTRSFHRRTRACPGCHGNQR